MKMGVSKALLVVLMVVILGHQTPKTNAQPVGNLVSTAVQVVGTLTCRLTRRPLVGATVLLIADNPPRVIANVTTGPTGRLNINVTLSPVDGNVANIGSLLSTIRVIINATSASCPSLTQAASSVPARVVSMNLVNNVLNLVLSVLNNVFG